MICWIESVDPVADLCLANQIYSVLMNAFELKAITEVQSAHVKMLLEDDETLPRGTQHHRVGLLKYYPRPPCAPSSSDRECFVHYRHISYFFNKSSLSLYVYTRGILGCLRDNSG